ncbi:hypothetical protein [Streptomyces mirabilis]|uniref:Uncharacterized protein n=1 Tax=Streptomyces mirabilis TaxID=68239 RepID=A0ABU3V1C6_9ACTN|nr:hypothetical protein [Streptomyces mirabilis]MCX4614709.1 hypothetical protein [Streptomyces mirabilis]MCX5346616.1 hypothetical protein [Streptomyces mirabilis]MDU8999982.1 hypothetical protein [Streptomyces mirabilis]
MTRADGAGADTALSQLPPRAHQADRNSIAPAHMPARRTAQRCLPVDDARGHHLPDGDDQLLHLRQALLVLRRGGVGPLLPPGEPHPEPHAQQRSCDADEP